MPPIVNGSIERRRSVAFFHDANWDAMIKTLPSCIDEDHPALYEPITVQEHIRNKIMGSRLGIQNPNAKREMARVLGATPMPIKV